METTNIVPALSVLIIFFLLAFIYLSILIDNIVIEKKNCKIEEENRRKEEEENRRKEEEERLEKKKSRNYVRKHSIPYKEMLELNKQYPFHKFKKTINFSYKCKSLNNFKFFDFENAIIYILQNNESNALEFLDKADQNKTNFEDYTKKILEIINNSDYLPENCEIDKEQFVDIQKELINEKTLKPQTTISFNVAAIYTSPKGRKRYREDRIFEQKELVQLLEKSQQILIDKEKYTHDVKVERSKMTPTLRYQILLRDNFRCQICGASAKDGAKLHVDHIIPVSKGGKTIESNLQTLCDRCNFGKSNKL